MARNYLSVFDPYTEAILAMFRDRPGPVPIASTLPQVPLAPLAPAETPKSTVSLSSTEEAESDTNPDGTKKTKEQKAAEREAKKAAKKAAKDGQKGWINSADFVAGNSVPPAARIAAGRGITVPMYTPMSFGESAPIGFRQGAAGVARAEAARQAAWLFSQQLDPNSPYHGPYMRDVAAQEAQTEEARQRTEASKSAAKLAESTEARNTENFRNLMDTRYAATLARANPFIDPFGGTTDNMSMDPRALMSLIATGKFRNPNEGYLADSTQVPPALSAYAGSLESGARAQTIEGNDLGAASLRSASIRPEDYLWSTTGGSTRDQINIAKRELGQRERELAQKDAQQKDYLAGIRANLFGVAREDMASIGRPDLTNARYDQILGAIFPDSDGVSYNYVRPDVTLRDETFRSRNAGAQNESSKTSLDSFVKTLPSVIAAYKAAPDDPAVKDLFTQTLDTLSQMGAPPEPPVNMSPKSSTPTIDKILAKAAKPKPKMSERIQAGAQADPRLALLYSLLYR